MRNINSVVVHCTATRPDWMKGRSTSDKVEEIRRWHVEDRGWSDIGYHWLIDRDGTVAEGRPVSRAGAHARGYNRHSIGVSLLGGHGGTMDDQFEENFTEAQEEALVHLLKQLKRKYPIQRILGHNEVANKACPTFDVPEWVQENL